MIAKKLRLLSRLANILNSKNIVWAVGGSLLLYFHGYVDNFNDIDIMVSENDAEALYMILHPLGELKNNDPNPIFKPIAFWKFLIEGIEVDVMGGFYIVKDCEEFLCNLTPNQIADYASLNGETIPLHSIDEWRRLYYLMNRFHKVDIIDNSKPHSKDKRFTISI